MSEAYVASVKATRDKETKNTFRYLIDENEEGISGTVYLNKSEYEEPGKKIQIKVRIKEA